jgi:hypothetical protein
LDKARERLLDVVLYNNLFLVDDDYVAVDGDVSAIKPKMEFVHTMHEMIAQTERDEGPKASRVGLLRRVLEIGVQEFGSGH